LVEPELDPDLEERMSSDVLIVPVLLVIV